MHQIRYRQKMIHFGPNVCNKLCRKLHIKLFISNFSLTDNI